MKNHQTKNDTKTKKKRCVWVGKFRGRNQGKMQEWRKEDIERVVVKESLDEE